MINREDVFTLTVAPCCGKRAANRAIATIIGEEEAEMSMMLSQTKINIVGQASREALHMSDCEWHPKNQRPES